ncbi:hypothetical protein B0H16DRAFT_1815796 [Mycena metata]|uniref:Uncharacterized protein n=1 Tax=Mycena metata TaxID=1033252 RepID=A0AAD7H4Q6_9AGAR|nr:hypothetical protein B0H16DRAFT_1815796 [Mycena metata]
MPQPLIGAPARHGSREEASQETTRRGTRQRFAVMLKESDSGIRRGSKGTRRRRRKVEEWDSEEDSEDGARDAEEDSEGVEANLDEGGDESGEESSSEDERPEHPRSSPIPPPAKRVRRVLDEVTNNERPVRQTTKNGTGRKTQTVAEVSQTYAAPYRTTSSRRRGVQ